MNKTTIICINCGNVQIRTDVIIQSDKKYTFLAGKHRCPTCANFTPHVATKDIKMLRKSLSESCANSQDKKILELIQR